MKFSKPGETETVESGGSDSEPADEMPVVESALTERLDLGPMPLDEAVESNANMLDQLLTQDRGERIVELEDRVEELERRNEELEESINGLIATLDRAGVIEVK